MKRIILFSVTILLLPPLGKGQNIGINTDGTTAQTGVRLDIKGSYAKNVTQTQNVFQLKSNEAAYQLKLRLILGTNVTATSMYGGIQVTDSTGAGTIVYRNLTLQPNGANVGIGTTGPLGKLSIEYTYNNPSPRSTHIYLTDPGNTNLKGYFGLNQNTAAGANSEYLSIEAVEETIHWLNIALGAEGGNVGIAKTVPTEKLDVAGNVRFSGALMPNNAAGSSGQVLTSAGAGVVPTWQTPASGGGGGDMMFPDGTTGTAVEIAVSGSYYTVPGGQTLYITSYYATSGNMHDYNTGNLYWNGPCNDNSGGNAHSLMGPIIMPGGTNVTATGIMFGYLK